MIVWRRGPSARPVRRGIVLVAVLVVAAVLLLVGYQFHRWMSAEAEAVYASNRLAYSRHLADSGLHYAAFILAHPQQAGLGGLGDLGDSGSVFPDPALLYHNPQIFQRRPVPGLNLGPGFFSIVSPRDLDDLASSSQSTRFGVEDEAGKINVNALARMDPQTARDMLLKLPGMTRETADAILTWVRTRDPNAAQNVYGDQLYYASQGYALKSGPLESTEEMLLVRGMTPRLLLGNDHNRNGVLEPEEDDSNGVLDPGLSRFLTLYSRERNVDSQGQPRIWINDPNLEGLHDKLTEAVGEELATFVIAYRLYARSNTRIVLYALRVAEAESELVVLNQEPAVQEQARIELAIRRAHVYIGGLKTAEEQKPSKVVDGAPRFEDLDLSRGPGQDRGSVLDLIDAEFQFTPPGEQAAITFRSPLKKDKPDRLREQLPILLDLFTPTRERELSPRININTASREVLRALPGLTEADVQVILDQRPSSDLDAGHAGRYRTPAWLVTDAGFPLDTLRSLEPYITARSQVFRMQVVGQAPGGTASARIEAVVDTNAGRPRILYWRDLTELGHGFR